MSLSGFIYMVFALVVPTYYGSLSLQAFVGIRNNFREESYRWIEKYIHLAAYLFPLVLASIAAATQNLNPNGSGCGFAKYPPGCEADPSVPCTRGENIDMVTYVVGFGLVFLYFVFPPSMVAGLCCWIAKVRRDAKGSTGMKRIKDDARGEMMRSAALQASLYLLSFWFTFVPTLIWFVYETLSGVNPHVLVVVSNCVFASQGFVFAVVYFRLERFGGVRAKVDCADGRNGTVQEIRLRSMRPTHATHEKRPSYVFNIFDGTPDEDSPWARFIDPDDDDEEEEEESGEDMHIDREQTLSVDIDQAGAKC
ncbi:hypothetical protein ACHAWF_014684 [Thalassiosira exigua]